MNIYNGNAGCGKSFKIKEDISNLNVKSDKILVLALNNNKKNFLIDILPDVEVVNWHEFIQNIIKKSPLTQSIERISDYSATLIIHSIMKSEFVSNFAMKNLCKSTSFARELYNLFGLFKINKFDYQTLSEIVRNIGLDIEDKSRFQLVINVYDKYNKLLKENNLFDFRDDILESINTVKSNELFKKTLQNRYEYIFVSDAQNMSQIQLELIKLIVCEDNIFLYGDNYAKIKSFMGASVYNPQELNDKNKFRNEDILKRALFICDSFLDSNLSDSIEYDLFFDFKEEINFIAEDIIKEVKNGANYSDFAILIRDNSIKQNIADILNSFNIPVNGQIYSESYQIFKYKFMQIIYLFAILEKLNFTKFDEENFKNIKIISKVDFEIMSEQINLITANILNEIIKDKYLIEKLSTLMAKMSDKLLIQTIFNNLDILPENDKKSLTELFNLTNELYQCYKNDNFVEIIVKLANIKNNDDINYNKFIAKFIDKTLELTNLKKNILKEKIDTQTILQLQDLIIEDNSSNENKINLLTFFKSAGLEFKKVYIPTLTENYFPKKTNYTYFISDNANKILSNELNKINKNFDMIIPTFEKELKDEGNLLYVAMTRAKEKVILSTHKFDGKQQVTPSSFYEALRFADEQNFREYTIDKNETEIVETEEEKEIQTEKLPVIDKDDKFTLSASAIKSFLNCPQRFFYKNLLNLKEESLQSADYGTIVHAVLELLLTKYVAEFSPQKAIDLAQILFNSPNNPKLALEVGFNQEIIDVILKFDNLTLQEMYQNLSQSVEELAKNNFFTTKLQKATCETRFNFSLPQIPNITFKGFVDAIMTDNTTTKLIDYKTTKDKAALKNLLSDDGVDFLDKNGNFSVKKLQKYEFQIPLYFLACKYSKQLEKFYGKINEFGYQYIRTEKQGGCKADLIQADILETYKDKIIENIQKYVVDEMYGKTEFEANYTPYNCQNCPYIEICDAKTDETDGEGQYE